MSGESIEQVLSSYALSESDFNNIVSVSTEKKVLIVCSLEYDQKQVSKKAIEHPCLVRHWFGNQPYHHYYVISH